MWLNCLFLAFFTSLCLLSLFPELGMDLATLAYQALFACLCLLSSVALACSARFYFPTAVLEGFKNGFEHPLQGGGEAGNCIVLVVLIRTRDQ